MNRSRRPCRELCKTSITRSRFRWPGGGALVILVMGVEGSGKTTVGKLLAQELGWRFVDADDFHSAPNKEKMSRGIPLDDADRSPWLGAIRDFMESRVEKGQNLVLACSALKQSYREQLHKGLEMKIVYLKGSFELFYSRLQKRQSHFARESLLASQFESLEEPADAISIDAAFPETGIVRQIKSALGLP
jgi:gluconokinase